MALVQEYRLLVVYYALFVLFYLLQESYLEVHVCNIEVL